MVPADPSLDSTSVCLEDELARWASLSGIAVETWALPDDGLPAHVDAVVRPVIRAVLAEIEQHGLARTVAIALTVSPARVRLTVSDDGAGMPVAALEARLAQGRAAFAAMGGSLTVHSVPREGTTVSGVIPRGKTG
ncbi:hypothetical protein ACQEUU_33640 [Nonomuraea sp. CA-218870]|uniref:hypothetical protein n=1 Tax=Nonomuraea sp. CA-218870 TaxID=3239998 RepID=UPI003D945897